MRLIPATRKSLACRATLPVVCGLLLAVLIPTTAAPAEPNPSTHRYIPSEDLVAYLEFDGLDAHADAWTATAAHAMLARTRAGAMTTEVARQWADWLLKENLDLMSGADIIAVYEHLMSKGFVVAIYVHGADSVAVTVVLKGLKRKELLDRFGALRPILLDNDGGGLLAGPTRLRGRSLYTMSDDQPPRPKKGDRGPIPDLGVAKKPNLSDAWFAAWFEGNDLIIVMGDDVSEGRLNSVFDGIEGKAPNVATHPHYVTALSGDKDIKGFEPAGLFFAAPMGDKGLLTVLESFEDAEPDKTGQLPTEGSEKSTATPRPKPVADRDVRKTGIAPAAAGQSPRRSKFPEFFERARKESIWAVIASDGLDEIKGISGRWGFQDKAFITIIQIEAPVPRKTLSVCLDQPTLNKTHLPPIPRGINSFTVASLDPARSYQTLSNLLNSMGSKGTDEVHRIEKLVQDETNLRLRDDLLKHVGPTWWGFNGPSSGGNGRVPDAADPATYVILTRVDDAVAFTKVLDALAARVDRYVRGLDLADNREEKDKKGMSKRKAAIERLPAPDQGYRLTGAGCRALGLGSSIQPVILVGASFIVLAADMDRAREAMTRTSGADRSRLPSGELVKALDGLPAGLTFLAVADHRDSTLPDRIVSLPYFLQFVCNRNLENDPQNASACCLFDLVGIPRPGGLVIKIERTQRPAREDLRALLFPSVLAGTVDDRGYRMISREAFPLELLSNVTSARSYVGAGWTTTGGFRFVEDFSLRIFGFDPARW